MNKKIISSPIMGQGIEASHRRPLMRAGSGMPGGSDPPRKSARQLDHRAQGPCIAQMAALKGAIEREMDWYRE